MKNKFYIILAATIITVFVVMAFASNPQRPHNYEPVMMSRADLEASFAVKEAREIESPGKLWVFNNYILLVEQYRGIHVIDNTSPNNPQRTRFINIEGCTELAVRDGIIYANNAVDLIGIKANSDFSSFEVLSRNRDVLPIISSPEHWNDWYFLSQLPANIIIVRWEPISN